MVEEHRILSAASCRHTKKVLNDQMNEHGVILDIYSNVWYIASKYMSKEKKIQQGFHHHLRLQSQSLTPGLGLKANWRHLFYIPQQALLYYIAYKTSKVSCYLD